MTMRLIETWIVEEKNPNTGASFTASFTDYASAIDVYNDLKSQNEASVVTIEKTTKKMLVEG